MGKGAQEPVLDKGRQLKEPVLSWGMVTETGFKEGSDTGTGFRMGQGNMKWLWMEVGVQSPNF